MSDNEIELLRRQIAAAEQQMKRYQSERDADRARELRAHVASELAKHGVTKGASQAAGHLCDVAKQVRHVDGRAVFVDAFGVETDLASGLKSWASSEEGGFYRDDPTDAKDAAPAPWTSVNRPASTDPKDQPRLGTMLAGMLGITVTPDSVARR